MSLPDRPDLRLVDGEITVWWCLKCGAAWYESWTGHKHCGQPVTPINYEREDRVEERLNEERLAGFERGWNA